MLTERNSKYHTFLTSAQDAKTQSNIISGRLVLMCPSSTSQKGRYTSVLSRARENSTGGSTCPSYCCWCCRSRQSLIKIHILFGQAPSYFGICSSVSHEWLWNSTNSRRLRKREQTTALRSSGHTGACCVTHRATDHQISAEN